MSAAVAGSSEAFLTRADGKKELIVFRFPTVIDRHRVNHVFRLAVGYRDVEEDEPSGDYNGEDVAAACWAAIGLSWTGAPLPELPTFRECGRDVVKYGEEVGSALFLAGFTDPNEQVIVGRELYKAFMAHATEAAKRAAGDFPKAQ